MNIYAHAACVGVAMRGMNIPDLFTYVEIERRRRIRLSVWAYAYEIAGCGIVADAKFDREAYASDPTIITGRLDDWWFINFSPNTGQWIHSHPEMDKLYNCYLTVAGLSIINDGSSTE